MTTIDGIRQDEKVTVPGHLIERIDFLSRMLGRSRSEVIVLAFDNFAPPVEHAAPSGRPGVGVQPCAPAPEEPQFLTAVELAARWGVSKQHIYNLLHKGLPSVTIGGRARRFRTDQVDAWIAGGPCVFGEDCGR